ncbi:MAG: hypothetical protein M0R37_08360 [Bacteroidales bacterium]|nr:hypothetical protein [Bacteroidales bacterium]
MKLKGLLLLGLLLSTGLVYAQSNFKPGYIIKAPGDTIYGQIDYRGDLLMGSVCKFMTDDKSVVKYYPGDIIAYRFIDGKYYISREVNNKKVFLECLIKGKVNIYYLRDDYGNHYYIDKDNMKLAELPYEEGKKYVNGKEVYYETTRHLGLLYTYMHDAPVMESRIKTIKKPEHKNLVKLAEYYHNVVCYGEKCIIYENKASLFKILPEISGGIINYQESDDLKSMSYMQGGITVHIWMPRTNEKLYFRTGLILSPVDFRGEECYIKIPCHFEYIYPKGVIKPRIAYGLNFYGLRKISSSLNFGFNFKLSKNFFISATSDIEFNTKTLIIPNSFLSSSLQLGVVVDFK